MGRASARPKRVVQPEYNKAATRSGSRSGSGKDQKSASSSSTTRRQLKEDVIKDPKLITPTGKFNVYNTQHDVCWERRTERRTARSRSRGAASRHSAAALTRSPHQAAAGAVDDAMTRPAAWPATPRTEGRRPVFKDIAAKYKGQADIVPQADGEGCAGGRLRRVGPGADGAQSAGQDQRRRPKAAIQKILATT